MDEDGLFGEAIAATYDEDDPAAHADAAVGVAVDCLAKLAGAGPALELAIGTGRIALPLAARGVPVAGIELSRAMVRRLRAKPGGDAASVPVAIGDMTTTRAEGAGTYQLVYLVFNTIMNLTTQDAQVACFQNAAAHLAPGGCFVIETMVPALRLLPPGQRYVPFDVSPGHTGIDEYDVAAQGLISHHTTFRDGEVRRASVPFRYVWPAELDLMARLAGMTLRDRWADWSRAPFTGDSPSHVSVWGRSPGRA